MSSAHAIHPVDEILPTPRLAAPCRTWPPARSRHVCRRNRRSADRRSRTQIVAGRGGVSDFKQWLPNSIHPLIESGKLLASIAAVVLNAFFNGASASEDDLRDAAAHAEA